MFNHKQNAKVQEYACWVLGTLATNSAHGTMIAQLGGIEAVIASSRSHPKNAAVQKNACAVFLCLGRHGGSQSELGEIGIDVMVAAMRNHPLETDIQAFASGGKRTFLLVVFCMLPD
jgi:hypothetical protein